MDLRQLEMFRAVARSGGFTRASEKLHVSHSAISRQIKLLEEELRVPLFNRAGKQVGLTAGGKALLPYVDAVFAQLQEAVQRVAQSTRKPPNGLHVGTGTTMLTLFLPSVLQEFQQRHPGVSVQIKTGHTSNILEDIRAGELDLGIVSLPGDARGLAVNPLYREEIVLAVRGRQQLASRKVIHPRELENLPLILFSNGASTRAVLDKFFEEIGIVPLVRLEVENDEAAERSVTNGVGACFLPIGRAVRDRIHYLRVQGHRIMREVALVCPHTASERVANFLSLCQGHAASRSAF